ncbi:MAG TPA: hypothetical protein VEL28_18690 [Candidatus Binatia bacterium]|nr:hypothetical protein [Candidatus Binatia bacterium]
MARRVVEAAPVTVLARNFAGVVAGLCAAILVTPSHAASLERFRASVHPPTGEVFACRSNSNLACAYDKCTTRHPDAAGSSAVWPCQKLSVADVGKGTEAFCAVGLYELSPGSPELFGGVACATSADAADRSVRAWGEETGKSIVSVKMFGASGTPVAGARTAAPPVQERPEPSMDDDGMVRVPIPQPPASRSPDDGIVRVPTQPNLPSKPPFLVIYSEPTNGRKGGGAYAFCTNNDRNAAGRCAAASCDKYAQYNDCIETGYVGRGGACAVASARKFGISVAGCAVNAEAARYTALANCEEKASRSYPGEHAVCEVVAEKGN